MAPEITLNPPFLSPHTGGGATAIGWSWIRPSFLLAPCCPRSREEGPGKERGERSFLYASLAHSPSPPSVSLHKTTNNSHRSCRLRFSPSTEENPLSLPESLRRWRPPPSLCRRRRRRNRRERSPLRWFGARRAVEARDVPVRAPVCRHCIGCRRGRHRRYRNAGDVTLEKQGTGRGERTSCFLPSFLRSSLPSVPSFYGVSCPFFLMAAAELVWAT